MAPKKKKKTTPLEPNVKEVVLGNGWIKPWYPSFYPEELVGRALDTLYVCQWCFKYTKELVAYVGHQVWSPIVVHERNGVANAGICRDCAWRMTCQIYWVKQSTPKTHSLSMKLMVKSTKYIMAQSTQT